MNTILEAALFASKAHDGQRRILAEGDEPFVAHPMRVAMRLHDHSDDVMAAALLHDVLEDTLTTEVDLVAAGFSAETVSLVQTLTRQEGETYTDFIDRVGNAGPMARAIKISDTKDNLLDSTGTQWENLQPRWSKALMKLTSWE